MLRLTTNIVLQYNDGRLLKNRDRFISLSLSLCVQPSSVLWTFPTGKKEGRKTREKKRFILWSLLFLDCAKECLQIPRKSGGLKKRKEIRLMTNCPSRGDACPHLRPFFYRITRAKSQATTDITLHSKQFSHTLETRCQTGVVATKKKENCKRVFASSISFFKVPKTLIFFSLFKKNKNPSFVGGRCVRR